MLNYADLKYFDKYLLFFSVKMRIFPRLIEIFALFLLTVGCSHSYSLVTNKINKLSAISNSNTRLSYVLRATIYQSHREFEDFLNDKRIRQILAGSLLLSILCVPSSASLAAIPTMDTYSFGNGSLRPDKEKAKVSTIFDTTPYDLNSLKDKKLSKNIKSLSEQVQMSLWDDIRLLLKKYKFVQQKYFGESSGRALADKLGISMDKLSDIESTREELSFTLGQLDDYCLSNRVIYFNTDDYNQVKKLLDPSEKDDYFASADKEISVEEPLALVETAFNAATTLEEIFQ